MSTTTSLKGVTNIGESLLSETLEANVVSFFDWALLGIGGFFDVTIPTSGAFGGYEHRLRQSEDPNYLAGEVWEGFRKNWVWESGVENTRQPIQVSGVYVNGNFHTPADTGGYSHHVNYPLGQVIFDSPLPTGSTVTCEYSYRLWNFYTQDVPWWQQIQFNSFRVDNFQFQQYGSGVYSIMAQNRVQLPAVVVEAVPETSRHGLEIGSLATVVRQDVLFHILTESPTDRKFMHDAITYQWQKRLVLFDKNALFSADAYPLTADGSVASGAKCYPALIADPAQGGFAWTQARAMGMRSVDQGKVLPLFWATVRGTFEVDLP